jgi:hypothetical protein
MLSHLRAQPHADLGASDEERSHWEPRFVFDAPSAGLSTDVAILRLDGAELFKAPSSETFLEDKHGIDDGRNAMNKKIINHDYKTSGLHIVRWCGTGLGRS